jgi:hypothetical protein
LIKSITKDGIVNLKLKPERQTDVRQIINQTQEEYLKIRIQTLDKIVNFTIIER